MTKLINKILIANRGEIACRIIKTCKKKGIRSLVVFSDADANSKAVQLADEAIHIGKNDLHDSYLNIQKIIEVAKNHQVDAIHPGFGFLSENAGFAQACSKNNILFIGPSPDSIEKMGSKKIAKEIIESIGVPTTPGYNGKDQSMEVFKQKADEIGYPVLLKAAMGGGGKGMRVVENPSQFEAGFEGAKREALNAFGDDTLLIEKFFTSVRHIEVQIVGDHHKNYRHLFERECSIQRRHQKIVEEAPSLVITDEVREKITAAALKIAKELNYYSLGTVEFILDEELNFYFLEVNTRIQVEHPVTEMITGLDLVDLQIDIAEGQKIPFNQEDVSINGHAIETRIYAENPENEFLPQTGQLLTYIEPKSARIDSGVLEKDTITVFFDPMIAKVITHGKNRNEALRKMIGSLNEFHISGVTTNKNFLIDILKNQTFIDYQFDTNYIANTYPKGYKTENAVSKIADHAIASLVYELEEKKHKRPLLGGLPLGWANQRAELPSKTYLFHEDEITVSYRSIKNDLEVIIGDFKGLVSNISLNNGINQLSFTVNGAYKQFYIKQKENRFYLSSSEYGSLVINKKPRFEDYTAQATEGDYLSPMPGEVIKLHVTKGDQVKVGDPLLVMLSMKMENTIQANEAGLIEDIFVAEKSFVEADTLLLNIKKQD